MGWIDLLGYAASGSVLITFCMDKMIPLRSAAICSNILFATFGALAHVYPVLALHLILFPVNCFRLRQALRTCAKYDRLRARFFFLKSYAPRKSEVSAGAMERPGDALKNIVPV
jgi:hypothetical protein